jgi:two-component system sensor histidine kinase CreC
MQKPAISTSAKLAFGLTILLAGAFYYLFSNLHERIEQQYFEAVEEPMVDAAHLFASLAELSVTPDGTINTDTLRETFTRARNRQFEAQIYGHLKKAVTMHVYVTDATAAGPRATTTAATTTSFAPWAATMARAHRGPTNPMPARQ